MRKLGVLFLVLFGSALLTGCGDDSSSGSAPSRAIDGAAPAPAVAPGFRTQNGPVREQSPTRPAPETDNKAARKEVVTGSVDLTAADPIAAAQTLADRVAEVDGRIDQRTENPGTDGIQPHANLVIRIPADETEPFIEGLGDLGEVTEISTNRDDVTLQWQDLEARIGALRTSVDRLRDLMARAADTADLIAAEEALATRQAELDSLTGQRRYLDDQITLSTLTIDITSEAQKTGETGPSNFWDGVVDGWNSLVDWLKDAVVWVGQALPWLGFLAVAGGVVAVVVRLFGRRKPAAAAPARPASAPAAAPAKSADSSAADSDAPGDADRPAAD